MTPAAPEREGGARVEARIALGSSLVSLLMLWQAWGRWRVVVAIVACYAGHVAVSRLVHPWWERRARGTLPSLVISTLHDGLNLAVCHAARWSSAAWLLVPVGAFSGSAHQARESALHVVLLLASNAALAALDGVAASTIAVNCALCVALYLLWDARTLLLRRALAALREERAKVEAAHRQLVEQEKLSSLGMLAAGVAHEINNPMAYVACNLRELAADLPRLAADPALLSAYREDVVPATLDGVARVTAVVADLRRFARVGSEEPSPFDLNAEVQAALRIAHGALHRAATEVSLGEVPPVLGRPQEIGRVVVNLLVNAGQAVGDGGAVRVATCARDGGVLVTVADDGVGMSAETRARLFEPFFTTKPVGQGTGLGLAVAHGIVARHGGHIHVESQVGRGSTFTVWLPRAPAPALAAAPPAAAAPGPSRAA